MILGVGRNLKIFKKQKGDSMKKIIEKPREMTCDKCGTLYSFEQEDIVRLKSNLGFAGAFVECPACGEPNPLKTCERRTRHE